ncbi:MAG: CopG family transcriptional regulator [Gammaproteobacteria bacterium]|nr:MAG: CopG family transcriptional regulator [Gammaproteobacteria bacterium]
MKAKDFDRAFNEGKDITDQLDLSKMRRPELEAKRLGVTRQSIIKMWLAERLKEAA